MSSGASSTSPALREVGECNSTGGADSSGCQEVRQCSQGADEGGGRDKGKGRAVEEAMVGASEREVGSARGQLAVEGTSQGSIGAAPPPTTSTAVSAVALHSALAHLATSSPSSRSSHALPSTLHAPSLTSPPLPDPRLLPSAASNASSSTSTSSATSGDARPPSKTRARISSLTRRLTSSPSTAEAPPDTEEYAANDPPRPKQRRHFSRSLPTLSPAGDSSAPTPFPTAPATQNSPWKGKGRFRRLLKKSPTPPTLSKPLDGAPPLASPNSAREGLLRARALSAPTLLSRVSSTERSTGADAVLVSSPEPIVQPSTFSSTYHTAFPSPSSTEYFDVLSPLQKAKQAPDRFAAMPRELQIKVMKSLLAVCEDEWRREVQDGEWKGERAKKRWNEGEARGKRKLLKVGRVSTLWRDLSLDGQLWSTAPSPSLFGSKTISCDTLVASFDQGGPFVRDLDMRGMGPALDSSMLQRFTSAANGFASRGTNLTRIDLTGCTSITSLALNFLLLHSPNLTDVVLLGLSVVDKCTMKRLGSSCRQLEKLDVSRCRNLRADALHELRRAPMHFSASSGSGDARTSLPSTLVSLKASGVVGIGGCVKYNLDGFSSLATLDVSFSNCTLAGLSIRPYPSLRHLNLSGSGDLSSLGLSHLANRVPNLEILELSRVGRALHTAGVVELLSTCPHLQKLDLEDADNLTDDVLFTLARTAGNLSHLVLSSCASFTDVGIAAVVDGCEKLRVLEADGTAIGVETARRFIGLAQTRALRAQDEAAAAKGVVDPLVRTKYPAALSVLDARVVARQLSRELARGEGRTRNGQRGYWTKAVGFYLDEDDGGGEGGEGATSRLATLGECDETKVVLRSFYTSLALDAALALREAKKVEQAEGGGRKRGRLGFRSRAMSLPDGTRAEDGRGCVVS